MFRQTNIGFKALMMLMAFSVNLLMSANAAQAAKDTLEFRIMTLPGAARHLDMLAYPGYLVVALENNGIKPANSGKVILLDERSIQLNSAVLKFVERKRGIFFYSTSLEWDIGVTQMKFDIPLEIDTSSAEQGQLAVRVHLPLANLFPEALTKRIGLKVQALTNPETQKKMLSYLDDLTGKRTKQDGLESIFLQIMTQAYNSPLSGSGPCAGREPGDAESLSDQAYLLATLAIWLIVVPFGILAYYLQRRVRRSRNM